MKVGWTVSFAALVGAFLAIYLPDIGQGFIQDDFRWIVESRVQDAWDVVALFGQDNGFYRPLVAMTFAADYALWATNAFGYALTNLAFCLAAAYLLFGLARRLGLTVDAALMTVGVWLFNFHAVNMALLWLSGRTALLLSLFSVAAAVLFMGGRFVLSGLACLAAMLSKEEAVALPALLSAFHWLGRPRTGGNRAVLTRVTPLWLALAGYLLLRLQSSAFWPTNAPPYYALSFAPGVVGRNIVEYADRAGIVAVAVILALVSVARLRWSDVGPDERRVLELAGIWIVSTYAITVLLPVRSSLYALLPSIGSALTAGAVAHVASRKRPEVFARVAVALVVAVIALVPLYRSRNARWVQAAALSERVMTTLRAAAAAHGRGGHVVLIDTPDERFNLDSAFGALLPEAVRLHVGGGWTGEVVPELADAQRPADLAFRLRKGQLLPEVKP